VKTIFQILWVVTLSSRDVDSRRFEGTYHHTHTNTHTDTHTHIYIYIFFWGGGAATQRGSWPPHS